MVKRCSSCLTLLSDEIVLTYEFEESLNVFCLLMGFEDPVSLVPLINLVCMSILYFLGQHKDFLDIYNIF